jgi:hypothetical protein
MDVINQILKIAVTIWANGLSSSSIVNVFPLFLPIGEKIIYDD